MLKNLKLLRTERGMSQKQLAERIGVSQQSVNKYENHNVEPDVETLCRLADCFGISVDYLIGRTEDRLPPPLSQDPAQREEQSLLIAFRALSPSRRAAILSLLTAFRDPS